MRIGIDCRPLIGQKTGIGYYLWEILNQWGLHNSHHELFLYSPRDFEVPSGLKNSTVLWWKRIFKIRPSELWMHTVAPIQMRRDKLDVFWGPNYAMPLWPIGMPSVLTVHDMVYKVYPETLKKSTYLHNRFGMERYVQRCQRILVPSENTKRDLTNFLPVLGEKVTVTPLGVSNRFESLRSENDDILRSFKITRNQYLLTVGTLEPRKNLHNVMEAFRRLRQLLVDIEPPVLVVIGAKGWGGTVHSLNGTLDGVVHYIGYVSDVELGVLYREARAFVYVPYYEGFGLPPLEAMYMGTPVLVSPTSSLPEVVGDCGLYANPDDPDDIANAMERLWRDESLRGTLSCKGRIRASSMTWSQTAQNTLEILESVGLKGVQGA